MQVALIAIAGEFRKGKSFLLNFFIRYLRHLRDGAKGDWLDPSVPLVNEFTWKRGTERHTHGVQLWSEPFFVWDDKGEEIVVLLADTQGTFDLQSSTKDNALIFSFATLISSTLVRYFHKWDMVFYLINFSRYFGPLNHSPV